MGDRIWNMTDIIRGTDHYWVDWARYDGIARAYYYAQIYFQHAYNNGSRFAWLKACDGLYGTRFFHNAYDDARKVADFGVGAYVWQDAGNIADPKKQADFWYAEVGGLGIPISIDFERYQNNIPEAPDLWASGYRLRELGFSGKLIVYTNWSYWLEHANSDPAWLGIFDGIWLADPDSPVPTLPYYAPADWGRKAPRPFDDYLFHQFSWTGDPALYGVSSGKKAVDENWFKGTEYECLQFFGINSTPPPPAQERLIQISITRS